MFLAVYQYLVLVVGCKLSSTICIVPTFHLYHTNTELDHCEAILRKLNKIWIQKETQITIIKIHGRILGFSFQSFWKILSHNIARVIMVQEINTVPYHKIDDPIIHQIHHQINVVKVIEVKILSFFINP